VFLCLTRNQGRYETLNGQLHELGLHLAQSVSHHVEVFAHEALTLRGFVFDDQFGFTQIKWRGNWPSRRP